MISESKQLRTWNVSSLFNITVLSELITPGEHVGIRMPVENKKIFVPTAVSSTILHPMKNNINGYKEVYTAVPISENEIGTTDGAAVVKQLRLSNISKIVTSSNTYYAGRGLLLDSNKKPLLVAGRVYDILSPNITATDRLNVSDVTVKVDVELLNRGDATCRCIVRYALPKIAMFHKVRLGNWYHNLFSENDRISIEINDLSYMTTDTSVQTTFKSDEEINKYIVKTLNDRQRVLF